MKWLHGDGGQVKKLQILFQIFIISFAIENLITGISRGESSEYYLYFCIPFFIIPLILFFLNTKIIFSIIFLSIASIIVVISEIGVFDGALLLIFALYLFKSQKFEIIALSIITIAISLNAFFNSFLPSQLFIMIRVYAFFYLIYFFTIRFDQKKLDSPHVTIPDIYISPDEKQLIQLLFSGKTRQEIYSIMGKSKTSINSYQNTLLVKLQAKTFEEVLLKLGKSVKIEVNSSDDNN